MDERGKAVREVECEGREGGEKQVVAWRDLALCRVTFFFHAMAQQG